MYSSVGRSMTALALVASATTAPTAIGNFHTFARMLCPSSGLIWWWFVPHELVSQHRGVGGVHSNDAALRLGAASTSHGSHAARVFCAFQLARHPSACLRCSA